MGNSNSTNRKRALNSRRRSSSSNLNLAELNYYYSPVLNEPFQNNSIINTLPDDNYFNGDRFSTSCTKYRLHMITLE